jgi:hypothetical protein
MWTYQATNDANFENQIPTWIVQCIENHRKSADGTISKPKLSCSFWLYKNPTSLPISEFLWRPVEEVERMSVWEISEAYQRILETEETVNDELYLQVA